MNKVLQTILTVSSVLFFLFIFYMVRVKKLELKYALTWVLTSFSFILLSLFPGILDALSALLHIKEPVNTLFISILFFLLLIAFTLTLALSRNANRVKTLAQELAILKLSLEKLKEELGRKEAE